MDLKSLSNYESVYGSSAESPLNNLSSEFSKVKNKVASEKLYEQICQRETRIKEAKAPQPKVKIVF